MTLWLPNFVIAGAPRCSTSAAFSYFVAHPQVAGSSVKEVQYFMDRTSALFHPEANSQDYGLERYSRFFEDSMKKKPNATIRMEATPGYLFQTEALAKLPDLETSPRFLFLVRRPSQQLYSSYLYSRNQAANLSLDVSFEEFAFGSPRMAASRNEFHRCALEYVRYVNFLERWRARCPGERMRVLVFEQFSKNLPENMSSLSTWLGIEPGFYESFVFRRENANIQVRSAAVHRAARFVRQLLPASIRGAAKGLYARANSSSLDLSADLPVDVMAAIDQAVAADSERLASSFDLDLSDWFLPVKQRRPEMATT